MKYFVFFILMAFLLVITGGPTHPEIDYNGPLEAHASAKKGRDRHVRVLAKAKSTTSRIVNGWWGLTVQIDGFTESKPESGETPQYRGRLNKRLYHNRFSYEDDGSYAYSYISGRYSDQREFYAQAYDNDLSR